MKKKKSLEELLTSMTPVGGGEVGDVHDETASAPGVRLRAAQIDALSIKELRSRTQLSQAHFAALLGVELSTLRNWEQGRRVPSGPARALLRALRNDPQNVIRALSARRVA
jgi:putative transcriptional regulator